MKISHFTPLAVFLTSSLSLAFNLSDLRGDLRREFRTPQGLTELCVVPKKWNGGVYKNGDIETENELCSYDFYTDVGVCPKYSSSNPGILMIAPNEKYSKQAIDASECNVDKMGVKTKAKYKQSISCSYTPSIVSYYEMSRIFGGIGRVPVTVLRTMDFRIHDQLTQKANRKLANVNDVIAETWKEYAKVHLYPRDYPEIVDSSLTQIYGALSDDVKNEERYDEVSGKGLYAFRYQRFMKQTPFLRVASSKSLTEIVGSTDFTKLAQPALQMKDIADMIVLDTLLNQQDRIGNIHYKFYWYYYDPMNPTKLERSKSDAKLVGNKVVIPPAETQAMATKKAALVKEMILKDNDCGVAKTNMMRHNSVLEKVRHISYSTYTRLMAFERALATPDAKDYFQNELLFTQKDFESLQANAKKAKEILKTRCQQKTLRFDIDLEKYLPGVRSQTQSCDI